MVVFELIVALLAGSLLLAALARRLTVPYPTLLALGGAALAFIPGAPSLGLDPQLALVLFVAPVLLDSGFDTSLRDLKDNWLPVAGLVFIAVGVTTVATAVVARWLVPELPWAAAVALGAIVAPPDAAAATTILKAVRPPHRLLTILEGESLLNDASALVVYRIAVTTAVGSPEGLSHSVFTGSLGILGSVLIGPALAWVIARLMRRITDIPTSTLLQFVITFGVWLLAERLHLSAVLTVVTYAITAGRIMPGMTSARMRVPSFAVWESVIFLLNVLAFGLVGLQLGPILSRLEPEKRTSYLLVAGGVLLAVVAIRFVWVMTYNALARAKIKRLGFHPARPMSPPTVKGAVLISWCGMRGIVTLAAAFALPHEFPFRDLLVLCAFAVVLGTLVLQGLTLPWLLRRLHFEDDDPVGKEAREARMAAYRSALDEIAHETSPSARALRVELQEAIAQVSAANHGQATIDRLRQRAAQAARRTVLGMRDQGTIGDAAFQRVEEELDRVELTTIDVSAEEGDHIIGAKNSTL